MPGNVSLVISILGRSIALLMSRQSRPIRWSTSLYALSPITASSRLIGSSTLVREGLQASLRWRCPPSWVLLRETLWFSTSTLTRAFHTWSKTSCTSDLSSKALMSSSLTARQDLFTPTVSSCFQDSGRLVTPGQGYGRTAHFQADAEHPECAVHRGPARPHPASDSHS